ncbi:MAG: hypothetical protein ABEJ56_06170 [Candidatus Nanohaloarchaea archaeon]
MEVETEEVEEGTLIRVATGSEVAVVVESEEGERIYLPESGGSDSTYYVDEVESLRKTESGYSVVHPGKAEEIQVLG